MKLILLALAIAFSSLSHADSQDKEMRQAVLSETKRLATAMYTSDPAELKGVKFSKPWIKDNKDGTYESGISVDTVNGNPVPGGQSFDFKFNGPYVQTATQTCLFCYEP